MKKKKYLIGVMVLMMAIVGGVGWQYWRVKDLLYEWQHRWTTADEKVESLPELEAILAEFETIPYGKLPVSYLEETESDQGPFRQMLSNKVYFILKRKDIYRKIIGNHRIKEFLPKDSHYHRHVNQINQSEGVYWLVDKRLLEKCLNLQSWLRKNGYEEDGFRVVNGYRPPAYNKSRGGASRSRHIVGQAVDILIKDINGDGWATEEDKRIVLKVLDEEIIGNSGGLGRYPGTMSVHVDVRGKRARWDQQ